MKLKAIEWKENKVKLIDQTKLPEELVFIETCDFRDIEEAIINLKVRGAPAIGIAGAFGVALAASHFKGEDKQEFIRYLSEDVTKILKSTRPTAKNLFWALEIMNATLF